MCNCSENVVITSENLNTGDNSNYDRRAFFSLLFCLLALFIVGGIFLYKKFDVLWWFLLFLLIIPYAGHMGYTIAQITEEREITEEE